MADFQTGVTYNRRADIHARFHGQMQGGISTPAKHSVIFAFTGTSGRRHGYSDELTQDGVFRYFGEGQEGDMTFTGGNRAIRDHANNGKELLLFDTIRSGQVRFRGEYNCAGYSIEPALDRLGKKRHAIVFHLLPVGTEIVEGADQDTPSQPVLAIELLRAQAYAAARPAQKGTPTESKHAHFIRSAQVRQYILARAGGACESCQRPAPFVTSVGKPYLEPHHIRRLSDGGPDDPRFVGALCPNCHREAHHGKNAVQLNDRLQKCVLAKEAEYQPSTAARSGQPNLRQPRQIDEQTAETPS